MFKLTEGRFTLDTRNFFLKHNESSSSNVLIQFNGKLLLRKQKTRLTISKE